MQINSLGSQAIQMPQLNKSAFSKVKENFEKLGTALESGNLSDAKNALAELQKNASKAPSSHNNSISSKMDALTKAVESGDLESAQKAYAEIKSTLSNRPAIRPGGAGGPPPGGVPMASGISNASESEAASDETYDVKDQNRDGKVSAKEELEYSQRQLESASQTKTTMSASSFRSLDVLA